MVEIKELQDEVSRSLRDGMPTGEWVSKLCHARGMGKPYLDVAIQEARMRSEEIVLEAVERMGIMVCGIMIAMRVAMKIPGSALCDGPVRLTAGTSLLWWAR